MLEVKVNDVIVSAITGKWYRVEEVTATQIKAYDLDSHSTSYLNRAGVNSRTFYKEEQA